jgi:thioesterase domain-containing protein/aryl carrier-like protein
VLGELPLTPNGKVDRAALPDVTATAGTAAPRSRTEAAVARIAAGVLGVDQVGIHNDFFALGAHSLLLVRLAAELRRALGADLPVAALMAAPTVAAVARLLTHREEADEAALAPVLTLHAGAGRPPLYCLPPASGLTWQFAGLKRYLPAGVPIVGLQSPALSGGAAPASLAELARLHADRIGDGDAPVRLLGWSFGGALALCLAAELTARGREVSFVGMLDTRRDTTEGDIAGLLRELGFHTPPGEPAVADAVALIRASDDPVAALTDDQIGKVVENYLSSDRLLANAEYPSYPGEVFFVDATASGRASAGWPGLRLVRHELPVDHSEMLDPATLEKLGPLLAEAIS